MSSEDTQWFFNPSTGKVAQGQELPWDERMGPYASEAEAHDALKRAVERNEAADAEDEADDNWGVPPKWEN